MNIDIIEQIRAANEQPFEEESRAEYNELKKIFVIDGSVEYPDPEYLIEIGGVPTMPKGNLVALSAKWKNGKTFFCDILTAIFLGSDQFASCCSRQTEGKVLFFDTEQAESDTARIHKTISAMTPQERHNDYEVFCLREAAIDTDVDQNAVVSRFEFISRSIAQEHPDLVIVDGIADLIYNYNDVIESQDIVSRLAQLANNYKCCIVVVMHQNKSSMDKNMKGHLGTMLYQKCSDVFTVEKHDSVFEVKHPVSRHRNCGDICFKLDDNAIPMDAAADRQLQLEQKAQEDKAKLHEKLAPCFEGFTMPIRSGDVPNLIQTKLGVGKSRAYQLFNSAKEQGVLTSSDGNYFSLQTL